MRHKDKIDYKKFYFEHRKLKPLKYTKLMHKLGYHRINDFEVLSDYEFEIRKIDAENERINELMKEEEMTRCKYIACLQDQLRKYGYQ